MSLKEKVYQAESRAKASLEKAEREMEIHLESDDCWCSPEVKVFPNGNRVIIHNRPN